jgi:hypothetical protein
VPDYRYTGDDARHYPSLGLDAVPDGAEGGPTIAEFDERPAAPAEGEEPAEFDEGARYVPDDGRWEPATPATPAAAPAPPSAKKTAAKKTDAAGDSQKED